MITEIETVRTTRQGNISSSVARVTGTLTEKEMSNWILDELFNVIEFITTCDVPTKPIYIHFTIHEINGMSYYIWTQDNEDIRIELRHSLPNIQYDIFPKTIHKQIKNRRQPQTNTLEFQETDTVATIMKKLNAWAPLED